MRLWLGALAAAVGATAAHAAAAPPDRAAAFKPTVHYKRLGVAGPYYPDNSALAGVTGDVVMDCVVTERLQLKECNVVSVTPQGFGFEDAAQMMAKRGWMTAAGPPSGIAPPPDGVWRFRVPFEINGRR